MTFTFYTELPAADMNRARRWYSEKLGLEPYKHGGEPVEDPARLTEVEYDLYYDTGSSRFGLYESWTAGRNEATAARLVVDDFDSVFADLLERGVAFENYDYGDDFRTVDGVLVSPDGEKTAWFKDSEGNILALGSS